MKAAILCITGSEFNAPVFVSPYVWLTFTFEASIFISFSEVLMCSAELLTPSFIPHLSLEPMQPPKYLLKVRAHVDLQTGRA